MKAPCCETPPHEIVEAGGMVSPLKYPSGMTHALGTG
jgi:hypothetical protein